MMHVSLFNTQCLSLKIRESLIFFVCIDILTVSADVHSVNDAFAQKLSPCCKLDGSIQGQSFVSL